MRRLAFCFPLSALLAFSAAAQDAVTIKLAFPKEGQRAKISVEEKSTTKSVFTVGGMPMSKEEVKTKSLKYIDEIIENPKNSRRATKLKRTYEKAVVGIDGESKTLPIEGKTVLIEKTGGKYAFTIDGAAVAGDSLKLLQDEFNKPDDNDVRDVMFPKTPIKPGETWKIEPAVIIKAIGQDGPAFDKDKISAGGKLVKAYMKDGKQFGVMEFVFEGAITALGDKNPLTIKDAKMVMKFEGDGCIDGSMPTGRSTGKMTLGLTGTTIGIDVKVVVESAENRTMELLPKK